MQARCLLPKRNEQALEEVFIGALLMTIGELAFWACDTEQASELARLNAGEASKVAVSLGIPQIQALLPGGSGDLEAPSPPAIDAGLQLRILRDLAQSLTEKPDLNTVFQLVLEGLHRGIGLTRVALLMSDREGRRLTLRKCVGPQTDSWREEFYINRDGSGPLGQLLPLGSSTIYHPPRNTVEQGFDPWLGRVPALTGPLLANGRMLGMFYADFGATGSEPTDEHLQAFSHFLQHAQLCLTLLSSQ
ncbi:hypothetical protein MLC59_08130 [Marinobacter bryozoorum]|uniref:hypothetical protein n=1 Tax=Marinobacter bryozoorum TaxID=256324 RepID=UPI002004476F|nr:hypothetical protein [Marinobacter bryozoorum]MCK7544136.1 hypothetical protein [Marinobacter bryozoorum]